MALTGGTILATLSSGALVRRFGPGGLNAAAAAMIACGLLGFSLFPLYRLLFVFAFIQGYGTGILDAGINNFVALHYRARYMNWLHCFYGIGAGLGPVIMAYFISREEQWRQGYFSVSMVCWAIFFILIISLPLWKLNAREQRIEAGPTDPKPGSPGGAFSLPGVKAALLCFFCTGSILGIVQVWGSTYLVMRQQLPAEKAAGWVSLLFIFITAGRFIVGLIGVSFGDSKKDVSKKGVSNKVIMRAGWLFVISGMLCLFMPWPVFSFAGFICMGLGVAPVLPAIVHDNPRRFGADHSQTITGWLFAASYSGAFAVPILGGILISNVNMMFFPALLVLFAAGLAAGVEKLGQSG
jgi:fucose permease